MAAALAIAIVTVGCAGPAVRLHPGRNFPSQPSRTMEVGLASAEVGKTPAGFQVEQTGTGAPAAWVVAGDAAAKRVLKQTSDDAVNRQRFPLCVYEPLSQRNVEASVQFKPISGKVDQRRRRVIVRYQDKGNYYVLRANPLEDNVRFYKYEKGKRSLVAGIPARITSGQWHTLTLLADGPRFICTFDGEQFEAGDSTFTDAGKIGLWTKADAVTEFDHLIIKSYDLPTTKPAAP